MNLGIMQPYFMPYIGYWQLLAAVDEFVLYDNTEYTKKGWINRNRILRDGRDSVFTVPLKKDSDFTKIGKRSVADQFDPDRLLNQLDAGYRKAPYFSAVFPLLASIVRSAERNLFEFIFNSIRLTAAFLEIKTAIQVSSTIDIDHSMRGERKVLAICEARGATTYFNPIGGQKLYSVSGFSQKGIVLKFIKPRPMTYPQFSGSFVPDLSIIDVMMFNSRDSIRSLLGEFDLV